jgi:hypothetical protein
MQAASRHHNVISLAARSGCGADLVLHVELEVPLQLPRDTGVHVGFSRVLATHTWLLRANLPASGRWPFA